MNLNIPRFTVECDFCECQAIISSQQISFNNFESNVSVFPKNPIINLQLSMQQISAT